MRLHDQDKNMREFKVDRNKEYMKTLLNRYERFCIIYFVEILNWDKRKRATSVSTKNLLSRVNSYSSIDRTTENEFCEDKPNSGAKLHQLMDTNPRADVVAAG